MELFLTVGLLDSGSGTISGSGTSGQWSGTVSDSGKGVSCDRCRGLLLTAYTFLTVVPTQNYPKGKMSPYVRYENRSTCWTGRIAPL